jgi:hypothetical protein
MRLIAAILVLAASQVAPANKPAGTSPRAVKQYTMEQFLDTTSIGYSAVLRFLDQHLKAAHE